MYRIAVLVFLLGLIPQKGVFGACSAPEADPWFNVVIEPKFAGEAIPGISFNPSRGVYRSTVQVTGAEKIVFLRPADLDGYHFTANQRADWIKSFKQSYDASIAQLLATEWGRPGAFEDENSIKFLVEVFNAVPFFKFENGTFYRSEASNYSDRYASRRWRRAGSQFIWDYDEDHLFPIIKSDNRPDDVKVPDRETLITDVALYNGKPYFIEKTATFSINQTYSKNALAERSKNFECHDTLPFDLRGWLMMAVWIIASVVGLGFVVYLVIRAIRNIFRFLFRRTTSRTKP